MVSDVKSEAMIEYATTPFKRMRGLLGRTGLPQGDALVITPCNAVHTRGMQFAIDLRFFNRKGVLVRTYRNVPPGKWFIWGGWSAKSVLECASGDSTFDDFVTLTTAY